MFARNNHSDLSGLPKIGITIGDAAGIGPEIVVKSIAGGGLGEVCRPVIIGDRRVIASAARAAGCDLNLVSFGAEVTDPGVVEIVDMANVPVAVTLGNVSVDAGRAAGECIEKAVALWKEGAIDAVATAPINKESLNAGGYDFPGHTEFLATLTGTREFAMSFFAEKLRVVLLSTHLPLTEAIKRVTTTNLVKLIEFSSRELSNLLKRPVRLAVAGLNPHASENGMFGSEEADEIIPAIEHCVEKLGIDVSGPYSPDTIFLRGFRGEFDGVIACYHDQATIAVKSLSFGSSVNVTLGLPLIRTSVDHGTAFDIAGKGIAESSSMTAAIKLAAELAAIERRAVTA